MKINLNTFILFFLLQGCTNKFESAKSPSSDELSYTQCLQSLEPSFKQVRSTLESKCIGCHAEGSAAGNTNLTFTKKSSNFDIIEKTFSVLNKSDINKSFFLMKPTAGVSHAGGNLINKESPEYINFANYVNQVASLNFCESKSSLKTCEVKEIQKRKIRRLTKYQIKNTLDSVFKGDFAAPDLIDDNPTIGLSSNPNFLTLNSLQLKEWLKEMSVVIDRAITLNSDLQNCSNNYTANCRDQIIDKYGLYLTRRPFQGSDKENLINSISTLTANGAAGKDIVKFILSHFLTHPLFFFRTETGMVSYSENKIVILDSYEVASLLSYSIWNGPPDEELFNAAKNGGLNTKVKLIIQAQRLLNSPKAQNIQTRFLEDVLNLDKVFSVKRNNNGNTLSADQRTALYQSSLDLISKNVDSSFFDHFQTTQFIGNNTTAPFFNLSTQGFNSSMKAFTPDNRYGILTHPTFLIVNANENTSGIVQRGVYTLEQILCHQIPPPPDNVAPVDKLPEDYDESKLTVREALFIKHSSQQSCISCHASIDNVGGGFENFDNFGVYRTVEKDNITIDASGVISGVGSLNISYKNTEEMIKKMTSSNQFKTCISKRFVEKVLGESISQKNKCLFESIDEKLDYSNLTPRSLIQNIVEENYYLNRKMEDK